jgi:hypothetical protein
MDRKLEGSGGAPSRAATSAGSAASGAVGTALIAFLRSSISALKKSCLALASGTGTTCKEEKKIEAINTRTS